MPRDRLALPYPCRRRRTVVCDFTEVEAALADLVRRLGPLLATNSSPGAGSAPPIVLRGKQPAVCTGRDDEANQPGRFYDDRTIPKIMISVSGSGRDPAPGNPRRSAGRFQTGFRYGLSRTKRDHPPTPTFPFVCQDFRNRAAVRSPVVGVCYFERALTIPRQRIFLSARFLARLGNFPEWDRPCENPM